MAAAILLISGPAIPGPLSPTPAAPTFANLRTWAGPDAESLGFTEEKVKAFLSARESDLGAARRTKWSVWLRMLGTSNNPSLRAWALTRRVEAGDYQDYAAFQDAITEHLLGLSKPGSGRLDRVIIDPPFIRDLRMPDALRIDHDSGFWRSLRNTVRNSPDHEVNTGLYSVWCYGTHPDQKDLILEVASQAQAKVTLKNRELDPWNDPRFWIVVDWAMAWGSREDFEDIRKALPEGRQRSEFARLVAKMEGVPAFFSTPPPKPDPPRRSLKSALEPLANKDGSVEFSFSQIRVMDQPSAPRYPEEAKARRMMTRLVLRVVVDPQGIPTSCRPVPGPWLGFFGPYGMEFGMRWRFFPAELNGVPQYARFRITMPFQLR